MAFPTKLLNDPQKNGSGERYGTNQAILSFDTFEEGLVVGRFAKLDTGSIDNLDASVAPVIAGVVLRDVANAVEDDNTISAANARVPVEVLRQGLVTVDVVTGDTPAFGGSVFVNNQATADAGKATTTDDATTEPTNAEFIEEIDTDVWLVRLI